MQMLSVPTPCMPGRALPLCTPHGLERGGVYGHAWALTRKTAQARSENSYSDARPTFPSPNTHKQRLGRHKTHTDAQPRHFTRAMAETLTTASPGVISQLVGHKNFVRVNPMSDRFEVSRSDWGGGMRGYIGADCRRAPHSHS